MTELINKLVAEAGLSAEQAGKSIEVVKDFVKEKFPMLAGAVDNVFSSAAAQEEPSAAKAADSGSLLDKISDIIPGEIGEKIEGFAKKAADVAEEGIAKAKTIVEDLEKKV